MTDQLTPEPEPTRSALSQNERRGNERFQPQAPKKWSVSEASGEETAVTVLDVSTAGMGFLFNQSLHPGIVVVIRLETVDFRLGRPLLARVMHCSPAKAGWWHVGCRFLRGLSSVELRQLGRDG